ncbi:MAG: squalene-hopene/tetraprenyl-beta-curcumene cyclase [Gaiellaceae bacterium]|nr:squalene-hopene/tetraprenyl-beta-curcumene cyclase [Gaiellaceae bacterium]
MTETILPASGPTRSDAEQALARGIDRLFDLQAPEGWWAGELETNVTMDAEDLLLREFLGIRTQEVTDAAARWIRSQQRDDGTWANFYGGPADLSTTIEAYTALRLAGDEPDADHMWAAADYIKTAGGIEASRVFTKIWLSLFGLWSWRDVPVIPPELIFLPPRFPLNVYDFACWARQTVVALSVVSSYRPVRPLAFGLDELRTGAPLERCPLLSWGRLFEEGSRVLHVYERRPVRALRDRALHRVERWIVDRQEADGSWGGIQPPWVYSLIALHLRGYGLDHPVMQQGLAGLDNFTIWEGDVRRLEACQSPVWDTALAVTALRDAGVEAEHPAVVKASEWLLTEEVRVPGDWSLRRPTLPPGGWAFEFENDLYPDIDDTAEVVLALRRAAPAGVEGLEAAVRRGVDWTLGMAHRRTGAWGAFDAENTRRIMRKLPFCDFGEVIDPPSSDVTAHVIEMLAWEGLTELPATQRGIEWLLAEQEDDGSWFGRWGVNYVYGTGAAVPALVSAGISPQHPAVRRAVAWLERIQNSDGGWGEDIRSYTEPEWRGRGASTASQTAWALLALHAAGERSESLDRGVRFLVETQLPDGGWDEPWYTGTGFPGHFYINYHLYRIVFPVTALGRILGGAA